MTTTPVEMTHSGNMSTEPGKAERFRLGSDVRISWSDANGSRHYGWAQAVNLSESGFAVLAGEPLPQAMEVYLELPGSGLVTAGRVRNCRRSGNSWRIGVELADPFPEHGS